MSPMTIFSEKIPIFSLFIPLVAFSMLSLNAAASNHCCLGQTAAHL